MTDELAVVTGAARGIGREVCRQLAARGVRVVLTARDAAGARAEAAALGPSVEGRPLDVADGASIAAFARQLEGARLHALVNNAGVSLRGFDAEVAAHTLATNYAGAAAVTDALLPLMPPGARVVMVSSGMGELSVLGPALRARFESPALDRAGLDALVGEFVEDVRAGRHRARGWPGNAYSVSKLALNALVRVLAPALRPRGVLVNAVCPGWVRTDMGGPGAPRSVGKGAAGVVWAATLPPGGPTGGFFRDGKPIPW